MNDEHYYLLLLPLSIDSRYTVLSILNAITYNSYFFYNLIVLCTYHSSLFNSLIVILNFNTEVVKSNKNNTKICSDGH